jgi:signal peptidase I
MPKPVNVLLFAGGISIWVFIILNGIRSAQRSPRDYKLAPYNRWYFYLLIAVVGSLVNIAVAIPFRSHVAEAYRMPVPSMEPTLLVGDEFMADKRAYLHSEPQRGDIAVYRLQGKAFVQRIVGLSGETIEIRERTVYINGAELEEPYAQFIHAAATEKMMGSEIAPTMIPADAYFFLGDNRDDSLDSRFLGVVPRNDILGKARTIHFSTDTENGGIRWRRIGTVLD